jgi:hypothetical protein
LTATLHLSARGRVDAVDCSFARQQPVVASSRGAVATCTWPVQPRFRGHRLKGTIALASQGETLVRRPFHVVVPRRR